MAVVLTAFATSLSAEGYLYPTGPAGGASQSCPGCPSPRTSNTTTTLGKVWSYGEPIVGFHRFLDSVWIKDHQQPFRTARAFKAVHAFDRNRIYMIVGGGAMVAYDVDTFTTRLKNRETLVAGAQRTEGKDLYLRADSMFYPEHLSSGWWTPTTDGQERLYTFDWDDKGRVYMAYTHFGWGIAQDAGEMMTSLLQACSSPDRCTGPGKLLDASSPSNIFVLKTTGERYYAFVGQSSDPSMRVYDVTTPASATRMTDLRFQPRSFAKLGNYFAVVNGNKVDIYTNDGFVNRADPFTTVSSPGGDFAAVTADGTRFYAVSNLGSEMNVTTIDVSTAGAIPRHTALGSFYAFDAVATKGYLVVRGSDPAVGYDALMFRLVEGVPVAIPLNQWVQRYYIAPPAGYVRPPSDHSFMQHASPLVASGKLYMMLSFYGLGDVIEIQSDSLAPCLTMTVGDVVTNYSGAATGCSSGGVTCSNEEFITFGASATTYDFSCGSHTFDWTFPNGVTDSGQSVSQKLPIGTHTVHVTIASTTTGQQFPASTTVMVDGAPAAVDLAELDIDGNGVRQPLSDGLMLLRYLFGFRGNALINGAIGSGATRTSAAAIETYLASITGLLDVDGNGATEPLSDGLLALRYLFGFRGTTLINGAVGAGATRSTSAPIEAYLGGL